MEYLAVLQLSRNVEKFFVFISMFYASTTTSLADIFQKPILPQSVPRDQDVTRFKKNACRYCAKMYNLKSVEYY
jgi:hypothetical protein